MNCVDSLAKPYGFSSARASWSAGFGSAAAAAANCCAWVRARSAARGGKHRGSPTSSAFAAAWPFPPAARPLTRFRGSPAFGGGNVGGPHVPRGRLGAGGAHVLQPVVHALRRAAPLERRGHGLRLRALRAAAQVARGAQPGGGGAGVVHRRLRALHLAAGWPALRSLRPEAHGRRGRHPLLRRLLGPPCVPRPFPPPHPTLLTPTTRARAQTRRSTGT